MKGQSVHPNFLRAFIEAVPDPLVLADKNRVIMAVNQAACDIFGYRENEMVGRSTAMMYADYDSYLEVGDRWVMKERLSKARYRARAVRKDGRHISLDAVGGFVRDGAGEIQGYIAIVANVTEKIRFQDFLEELTVINTAQGLGTEQRINALLKLGCSSLNLPIGIVANIRGDDYLVEFAEAPQEFVKPGTHLPLGETFCVQVLKAGGPVGYNHVRESEMAEHPCYRATRLESFLGAPLLVDGERYGTINFSSTEPRAVFSKTEEQMIKLLSEWIAYELSQRAQRQRVEEAKRDAERRLEEREKGLSRLREDLAVAARAADMAQFSSATAHEINQPLAALVNYLTAGRRFLRTGSKGRARACELFAKALAQVERAGAIVAGLQNLSEKGAGRREAADIVAVVEEAIPLALSEPQRSALSLRLQAPPALPRLQMNRVQIQQVLINIIRNAQEASASLSKPRLEIVIERLEQSVSVSVLDNGPGFEAGAVTLTGSRFRSAKPDGMGIGLSICRSLVEGHGGELRLDNQGLSGGARVSFTLPLAEDAA